VAASRSTAYAPFASGRGLIVTIGCVVVVVGCGRGLVVTIGGVVVAGCELAGWHPHKPGASTMLSIKAIALQTGLIIAWLTFSAFFQARLAPTALFSRLIFARRQ